MPLYSFYEKTSFTRITTTLVDTYTTYVLVLQYMPTSRRGRWPVPVASCAVVLRAAATSTDILSEIRQYSIHTEKS